MLTKEAINNAVDRQVIEIDVPEWKGSVGIGKMSFSEVRELQKARKENPDGNHLAKMLAYSICDENGNRLFSDDEITDIEAKNYHVFLRLVNEVSNHNGLTENIREETEKNSEGGQTGDSTST